MRRAMIFTTNLNGEASKHLLGGVENARDLKLKKDVEYVVQGQVKDIDTHLVIIDENGNFVVVNEGLLETNYMEMKIISLPGEEIKFEENTKILKWYLCTNNINRLVNEGETPVNLSEKIEKQLKDMLSLPDGLKLRVIPTEEEIEAERVNKAWEELCAELEECDEEEYEEEDEEYDCDNCDEVDCVNHPHNNTDDTTDTLIALAEFGRVVSTKIKSNIISADILSRVNDAIRSLSDVLDEKHNLISDEELDILDNAFTELCDKIRVNKSEYSILESQLDDIGDYIFDLEDAKHEEKMSLVSKKELDERANLKDKLNNIVDMIPAEELAEMIKFLQDFNN